MTDAKLDQIAKALDNLAWKLDDLASPSIDFDPVVDQLKEIDGHGVTLTEIKELSSRIVNGFGDALGDKLAMLDERVLTLTEAAGKIEAHLERAVMLLDKLVQLGAPPITTVIVDGPKDREPLSAPGAIERLAERTKPTGKAAIDLTDSQGAVFDGDTPRVQFNAAGMTCKIPPPLGYAPCTRHELHLGPCALWLAPTAPPLEPVKPEPAADVERALKQPVKRRKP